MVSTAAHYQSGLLASHPPITRSIRCNHINFALSRDLYKTPRSVLFVALPSSRRQHAPINARLHFNHTHKRIILVGRECAHYTPRNTHILHPLYRRRAGFFGFQLSPAGRRASHNADAALYLLGVLCKLFSLSSLAHIICCREWVVGYLQAKGRHRSPAKLPVPTVNEVCRRVCGACTARHRELRWSANIQDRRHNHARRAVMGCSLSLRVL